MAKIDIARVRRAMADIRVSGIPSTSARKAMIAEAIESIQKDPADAMSERYFGIKNYAHFGDQREDHQYGYGPKHGHIVFRIGRLDGKREKTLSADHVYALECLRDFGSHRVPTDRYENDFIEKNLFDVIADGDELAARLTKLMDLVNAAEVETHEAVAA